MSIFFRKLDISSIEKTDFIDITDRVSSVLNESGVSNGFAIVYSLHTTAGIKINENEPRLIKDFKGFINKTIPPDIKYFHDDTEERENVPEHEPRNAHSHIKALVLPASEFIPVIESKLKLGRWQHVFFVDFDGPRKREVIITIIGS